VVLVPRLPGSRYSSPAVPSLRRVAVASPRPCRSGAFRKMAACFAPLGPGKFWYCQCRSPSQRQPAAVKYAPTRLINRDAWFQHSASGSGGAELRPEPVEDLRGGVSASDRERPLVAAALLDVQSCCVG
jgi:hypothetical protein